MQDAHTSPCIPNATQIYKDGKLPEQSGLLSPMDFVLPDVPLALVNLPAGTYGISYDISTRFPTQGDIPNGWNPGRGKISFRINHPLLTIGVGY